MSRATGCWGRVRPDEGTRQIAAPAVQAQNPAPRSSSMYEMGKPSYVFRVKLQHDFAGELRLVGNVPELGRWIPREGLLLTYCHNVQMWQTPPLAYAGPTLQYKFVYICPKGGFHWEDHADRSLDIDRCSTLGACAQRFVYPGQVEFKKSCSESYHCQVPASSPPLDSAYEFVEQVPFQQSVFEQEVQERLTKKLVELQDELNTKWCSETAALKSSVEDVRMAASRRSDAEIEELRKHKEQLVSMLTKMTEAASEKSSKELESSEKKMTEDLKLLKLDNDAWRRRTTQDLEASVKAGYEQMRIYLKDEVRQETQRKIEECKKELREEVAKLREDMLVEIQQNAAAKQKEIRDELRREVFGEGKPITADSAPDDSTLFKFWGCTLVTVDYFKDATNNIIETARGNAGQRLAAVEEAINKRLERENQTLRAELMESNTELAQFKGKVAQMCKDLDELREASDEAVGCKKKVIELEAARQQDQKKMLRELAALRDEIQDLDNTISAANPQIIENADRCATDDQPERTVAAAPSRAPEDASVGAEPPPAASMVVSPVLQSPALQPVQPSVGICKSSSIDATAAAAPSRAPEDARVGAERPPLESKATPPELRPPRPGPAEAGKHLGQADGIKAVSPVLKFPAMQLGQPSAGICKSSGVDAPDTQLVPDKPDDAGASRLRLGESSDLRTPGILRAAEEPQSEAREAGLPGQTGGSAGHQQEKAFRDLTYPEDPTQFAKVLQVEQAILSNLTRSEEEKRKYVEKRAPLVLHEDKGGSKEAMLWLQQWKEKYFDWYLLPR